MDDMIAQGWQEPDQLPSLVPQRGDLECMIRASRRFAERWGTDQAVSELLPELKTPIPGDKMRINLVTATLMMGGAERHTCELARALARLGYVCTVVVGDMSDAHQPLFNLIMKAGIRIVTGKSHLPEADATIWWGNSMRWADPPGSIFVAHSASKLVAKSIRDGAADIDRIVGVSRPATAAAHEAHPAVPASTIWNGVDRPCEPLSRPRTGSYTLGYLGRYDTEKGVALAIAALEHTSSDVRLRCYGRGPHKGALADAADAHGVGDRVDICGVAPGFYAVAHEINCLIVPDLVQGFPLTVCEALLAKVPVVAVGLGDLEHVLDGCGVAVDPTPEALACGVEQIRKSGPKGIPWAVEQLTADAMAAAYTHVIHEVAR